MKYIIAAFLLCLIPSACFSQTFNASDPNVNVSFSSANRQAPAQNNSQSQPQNNAPQVQGQQIQQNNKFSAAQYIEQEFMRDKIARKPDQKVSCNRDDVCVIVNVFGDKVSMELENRGFATNTVNLSTTFNNAFWGLNSAGKYDLILKGKERKFIDTLYHADKQLPFSFDFTYVSNLGNRDAVHNDKHVYDLPFQYGKKFKLLQGYGGKFSHSNPQNYYAYDFKMPNKTQIIAAREGRVIKVIEKYSKGGPYRSLLRKANQVYIEHPDGTIAMYTHLYKKGALVNVGDYVQKGQNIGYSGNTGYSDSPHLHFNVSKMNSDGNYISLPIKIRTTDSIEKQLRAGSYYQK